MQPIHKTPGYLGPLPPELFICIIALSISQLKPIKALIRLEQLRLVSKTWLITIDSTPRFWATIPNDPKTALRVEEWIKKSGESPLHIISYKSTPPPESFMSLAHRWKAATICDSKHGLAAWLHRPAPLLENLTFVGAPFGPDANLSAGVMPSLTRVDLTYVNLPRNHSILKSLKEISLHMVTCTGKTLSLGQICDILSASPNLRRLYLDLICEEDVCHRPPLSFPNLEDLRVRCTECSRRWTANLLSIMDAPNLINMAIEFDRGPPLQHFRSWLANQSLHKATPYLVTIDLSYEGILDEKDDFNSSPRAQLFLSDLFDDDNTGVSILEEIDRFGAETAPLTVDIRSPFCVVASVDYLKQPKVDQDGIQRLPLPTLHSIQFVVWSLKQSWHWISSFAQVRKDVARITIKTEIIDGSYQNVEKWNAENEGRIIHVVRK